MQTTHYEIRYRVGHDGIGMPFRTDAHDVNDALAKFKAHVSESTPTKAVFVTVVSAVTRFDPPREI